MIAEFDYAVKIASKAKAPILQQLRKPSKASKRSEMDLLEAISRELQYIYSHNAHSRNELLKELDCKPYGNSSNTFIITMYGVQIAYEERSQTSELFLVGAKASP